MSTSTIREIRENLDNYHDTELDRFCQENYFDVYNNFTRGMRKDEKITHLIDYAIRKKQIDSLASILKEISDSASGINKDLSLGIHSEKFTYIKLQIQALNQNKIRIRGIDIPGGGTPIYDAEMPFSARQLKAILKALEIGMYIPSRFKSEYTQTLRDLGLLVGTHLHADLHKIIGRKLYDSIFRDEILASLRMAQERGKVVCQLLFDPDEVIISQFPWELIYDGSIFVVPIQSGIELIRCINIATPIQELKLDVPLKVLYIAPRPKEDNFLPPDYEKQSVQIGLEKLLQRDLAQVNHSDPTFTALEKELRSQTFHILHFDGHGSYAKNCPNCHLAHYPSEPECRNCGESLVKEKSYGYLHFENENGLLDRINVDDLKVLLANKGIQLMILTSCNSSISKEDSIFNGIAPGLLQANIPAIIAMQGSPNVEDMNNFVLRFYDELSSGKRIAESVNSGRMSIYNNKPPTWFIPTVFVRTSTNNSMALKNNIIKGE